MIYKGSYVLMFSHFSHFHIFYMYILIFSFYHLSYSYIDINILTVNVFFDFLTFMNCLSMCLTFIFIVKYNFIYI